MLWASPCTHTHHNKVVEDGGDQVRGDEGEVRGQELCVGTDGDVGGELREDRDIKGYVVRCHAYQHLQGSQEAFAGVKLEEFVEYELQGVAELADGHGDALVEDARQLLLYVHTTTLLQGRTLNNAHHLK